MDYITVKEASQLWHTDISTIGKMLRAGKIPDAAKIGDHWVIPRDTSKPIDGRLKLAKNLQTNEFFRFPFYIDLPENSYIPRLTEEERQLRQAQKEFFACDFERAKKSFTKLIEETKNEYIKISALFFACVLSVYSENGTNFSTLFSFLNMALVPVTEHRMEMTLFISWLYFFLAEYNVASESIKYVPDAEYSKDCITLISMLAFSHLSKSNPKDSPNVNLDMYELMCKQAEQNGKVYEAEEMHLLLFQCYHLKVNKILMSYHLRKALSLAQKNELILTAASYAFYYPDEYNEELADYPKEFSEKIMRCGNIIHESFSHFMSQISEENIYKDLSAQDYQYAFYAVMEYSNKKIAEIMNKSEKTIANRFNEIYEKLGIKGRKELKSLMNSMAEDLTKTAAE